MKTISSIRRCCAPMMLAATLALAAGSACAVEIKLPEETAKLRPSTLSGAQKAAQCYMCHSVDYISSQPPMGHGFWEAEVNKMVKTYGAPIPPDQLADIVQYLTDTYGTEAKKQP